MRRRDHWDADRQGTLGLQFEGAPRLIELVERLTRRPWRWGAERLLPILRLVRHGPGGPDPLGAFAEWLRAGGVIPWAHVDPALSRRQPATVEDLLDLAVTELADGGGPGRRLRFPHYGLGLWLVHLDPLSPSAGDREKDEIAARLRTHLRQRLVTSEFGSDLADAVGDFPWWVRLSARSMPRVALALMRASWRPPRWFARSEPARGRGFYALARDFARPDYVEEHRDAVDRLLVGAFLYDLRVAYRRGSVLGAGRRRTRYPVLLLGAGSPASERLTPLNAGGYDAALEELRGLAIAQREALGDQVPIRLLLANAGDQMDHGRRAGQLVAAARDRERIVAVTGLGISRTGVRDAILSLAEAGIPTLGTLLTADTLPPSSFYYHQIGPANRREAAVAAYYANAKLNKSTVTVVHSADPADLYSANLAADANREFTARGVAIRETMAFRTAPGMAGDDVTSLGQRSCGVGRDGLVFYAGRPDDFGRYLQGMSITCPDAYPHILAGDAITQSVLTGALAGYPGLPLDFLTTASSAAWGPDCTAVTSKVNFFRVYEEAGYGRVCEHDQARAMFGYDALRTVRRAITLAGAARPGEAVRPDAVLHGLTGVTGDNAVAGVTGLIDFGSAADPQLPLDKAMLVMGLTGAGAELRLLCGTIPTAAPGDPGCPRDPRAG